MTDLAETEREAIIAWINECIEIHEANATRKGQVISRRHHIDACRNIAAAIARQEHHMVRHHG